jgi:integrase
LARKTIRRYQEIIDCHIAPALGSVPLAKLSPLAIETVYAEARHARTGNPLSGTTLRHIHRCFSESVKDALRLGAMVGANPFDRVIAPKATTDRRRTMTPEEVRRLLAVASDPANYDSPRTDKCSLSNFATLYHVTAYTGMREGELLALRWQDVEPLEAGIIRVRRSLSWLSGEPYQFKDAKTESGERDIAIGQTVIDALTSHKLEQRKAIDRAGGKYRTQGLVFADGLGGPLSPTGAFRSTWSRVTKLAGLEGFTFHDLRHSHLSLMLANGEPLPMVSERAGHANPAITARIYAHALKSQQAEAARRFDAMLSDNDAAEASGS